eukprot:TRINITY_DN8608_c0_g1_i5.p1 TRINITY_DN8608_c0_g1~~TRINITY_DN8608_c0_g1_i5.p1  ORF type:complete len:500 (-),score=89.38 TRINITY_DN8608_c0_g1_i5:378-1853(-)
MAEGTPSHTTDEGVSTLWFGGLPTDVPPETIEEVVRTACSPYGELLHVAAARFGTGRHRARRYDKEQNKLHFGIAYAYFPSSASAAEALAGLNVDAERRHPDDRVASILSGVRIAEADKPPPLPPTEDERLKAAAEADEKASRQADKKASETRRRRRGWEALEKVIERITKPGGMRASDIYMSELGSATDIDSGKVDWNEMPASLDPQRGAGLGGSDHEETVRSRRKRQQVEVFSTWLRKVFNLLTSSSGTGHERQRRVVDFGSGSGNMTLPLAFLFPHVEFVAVDMKKQSIDIMLTKAQDAGLQNVRGHVGMIETYQEPFDVAIALHACGNATDFAMLKAAEHKAAFVVSPCCVGKLKFSLKGGNSFSPTWKDWTAYSSNHEASQSESVAEHSMLLQHPRSLWLRNQISEDEFSKIATAADHSVDSKPVQKLCKLHVEIDRAFSMRELGYYVGIANMSFEEGYSQNECIIGIHEASAQLPTADSALLSAL